MWTEAENGKELWAVGEFDVKGSGVAPVRPRRRSSFATGESRSCGVVRRGGEGEIRQVCAGNPRNGAAGLGCRQPFEREQLYTLS